MDIKNEILWRIYVVALAITLAAAGIFFKAVKIQVVEGEHWRSKADSLYVDYRPINAERGNVFSSDGSLLATSLPMFEVRMDTKTPPLTDEIWTSEVDTLAKCLSELPNSRFTEGGFKDYLEAAREKEERFLLIKKDVTYPEMQAMKQFPIFNRGQYEGGFIAIRQSKRQKPFGMLAHRTIGYVRDNAKPVGLEGSFNDVLAGEQGKQLMQRVTGGHWLPMHDITAIEPEHGQDVLTTIDINIQDVTENALLRAIRHHDAKHGCAIVMEVATGKIKAIANIGKTDDGNLWETYNFAIGASTEPGSTFKAAAMLALAEDGFVNPEDSIDLQLGKMDFYEETMEDASYHLLEKTTVRKAFEISSNVGIAQLVHHHYQEKERQERFIKRLKEFNLHKNTEIEIEGEGNAYIKEAFTDGWSGTTIPWMSIGYELKVTPLQMLAFYNAIANNGRMMKPYIVSEIQDDGRSIKNFYPEVTRRQIAGKKAIAMVKEMLEGVVQRGTAKRINSETYKMAGKTGTAILNYKKDMPKGYRKYQASFAGYFPADNPKYSCIVVINTPRQNGFYGAQVAAPVFRDIADKCFATDIELHEAINKDKKIALGGEKLPDVKTGVQTDIAEVLDYLKMPYDEIKDQDWVNAFIDNDTIDMKAVQFTVNKIPDVRGMGLRDATHLLGNLGLRIQTNGVGTITRQSIRPGTTARGQTIRLTMN
ncbi:MAG: penicillin-binding protein [Bacteroidota bacterium]